MDASHAGSLPAAAGEPQGERQGERQGEGNCCKSADFKSSRPASAFPPPFRSDAGDDARPVEVVPLAGDCAGDVA